MKLKSYSGVPLKFRPKDVVIDMRDGNILEITGYDTEYTDKVYNYVLEVVESDRLRLIGQMFEVSLETAHQHFIKDSKAARTLFGR